MMKIYDYRTIENADSNKPCMINVGMAYFALKSSEALYQFKEEHPNWKVLIDLKLDEDNLLDAKLAYDYGADVVSVDAHADDETLKSLAMIAEANNGALLMDVRNVENRTAVAENASIYGVSYVIGTSETSMIECGTGRTARSWFETMAEERI